MYNQEALRQISILRKQRRYYEIFALYGKQAFQQNTPKKFKKQILKKVIKNKDMKTLNAMFTGKMLKQGRYKIKDRIEFENSPHKIVGAVRYGAKKFAHSKAKNVLIAYMCMKIAWTGLVSTMIWGVTYSNVDKATAEYSSEIAEYQTKAEQYATYIKSLNLTDLEQITKMMSDMWENIDGYGAPELDIPGYGELDVSKEGGIGVCRNMASDLMKKMNFVNPEYKARLIYCDLNHGDYKMMNIERKFVEETTISEQEQSNNESFLEKYAANHVIVAFNMPGESETFVVDPTNPSIGILQDGEIKLFNSKFDKEGNITDSPLTYDYKSRADWEMNRQHIQNQISMFTSHLSSDRDFNKLEEEYGVSEQNEAVKTVEAIEDDEYVTTHFYK